MLTLEQTLAAFESKALDGRDAVRLSAFVPVARWGEIGLELKAGFDPEKIEAPRPWEHAEILKQLRNDVSFGFEKALARRGISASLMYEVVKMWMRVLEDPLAQMEDYAQYGLPLFKAVAVKYCFDNPIGDDRGDEFQYNSEYDG